MGNLLSQATSIDRDLTVTKKQTVWHERVKQRKGQKLNENLAGIISWSDADQKLPRQLSPQAGQNLKDVFEQTGHESTSKKTIFRRRRQLQIL